MDDKNKNVPENGIMLQWREGQVGVPHAFSRSNLFTLYGHKQYDDYTSVTSADNYDVKIKGPSMTVYDLIVYTALMNICWDQNIIGASYYKDVRINQSLGDLAVRMGDKRTTANAVNIDRALKRLSSTIIQIQGNHTYFAGSLISYSATYKRPTPTTGTKASVYINKQLQNLYKRGRWGAINSAVLQALGRDYIAIRLYIFFCSFRHNRSHTQSVMHYHDATKSAYQETGLEGVYFYGCDKLQQILGINLPPYKAAKRLFEAAQKIQRLTFTEGYLPRLSDIKVSAAAEKKDYKKHLSLIRLDNKNDVMVFYMCQMVKPNNKHKYKLGVDFLEKIGYDQRLERFSIPLDCTWTDMKKKMAEEAEKYSKQAIEQRRHDKQVESYNNKVLNIMADNYL